MRINNKPSPLASGLVFSLVMILTMLFGYYVQKRDLYSGLLITEFVLILMPCIFIAFLFKLNFKETFKLKPTKPINLVIAFFIAALAIPAMIPINMLVLIIEKYIFGKIIMPDIPNAANPIELLIFFGIIACSPAICEELMFRGIIQTGMEKIGIKFSIIMNGILFGLFHVYMQKFFPTFALGVLFAVVAYITKSVYTTMVMHFANNGISVLVGYFSSKLVLDSAKGGEQADKAIETILKMPLPQIIGMFVVYGFLFVGLSTVIGVLIYLLVRINTKKQSENIDNGIMILNSDVDNNYKLTEKNLYNNKKKGMIGLLTFIPGILVVLTFYENELVFLKGGKESILKTIYQFLNVVS
jgi:membrane protease YdiL (CAAX protease family)